MQQKTEVTQSDFAKAIMAFKKRHQDKLKNLLNKKTHPELVKEFLSNPIIQTHLTRPSVTFFEKHPELRDSSIKEEHERSDHYELRVYKYLANEIMYRNEGITGTLFYGQGTRHTHIKPLIKARENVSGAIRLSLNGETFNFSKVSDDIDLVVGLDIYRMATVLIDSHVCNIKTDVTSRFRVFYHGKDAHACAMLAIVDPKTQRALVTLLINSWSSTEKNDYYNYLKEDRFLDRRVYKSEVLDRLKVKQELLNLFSIDIDDATLLEKEAVFIEPASVDSMPSCLPFFPSASAKSEARRRVACLIEPTYIENSFSYPSGYKSADQSSVDKIYVLSKDKISNTIRVSLFYRPSELFIDASHHLQVAADDANCGIYSFNFIHALIEMLKNPDIAEQAYQLAVATDQHKPTAETRLVRIFQEELKAYLPCYYERETGLPKSIDELSDFHLKQRWTMGGQSLALSYPVQQEKEPDASTPAP